MDEITERYLASALLVKAQELARHHAPADVDAAAAAMLCRAVEIATADLSPERRAGLFLEGDE